MCLQVKESSDIFKKYWNGIFWNIIFYKTFANWLGLVVAVYVEYIRPDYHVKMGFIFENSLFIDFFYLLNLYSKLQLFSKKQS